MLSLKEVNQKHWRNARLYELFRIIFLINNASKLNTNFFDIFRAQFLASRPWPMFPKLTERTLGTNIVVIGQAAGLSVGKCDDAHHPSSD